MTLLYAALRRAETDAERLDALRAASPEELAALYAALLYRNMIAESTAAALQENASFAAFSAALGAASSDAERRAVIEAARAEHGEAWLARWVQSRTSTPEKWILRYREAIGALA
jgi:hypothetical protein